MTFAGDDREFVSADDVAARLDFCLAKARERRPILFDAMFDIVTAGSARWLPTERFPVRLVFEDEVPAYVESMSRYRRVAAEQGSKLIRCWIALRAMAEMIKGDPSPGFATLRAWIETDGSQPIAWPGDDPMFEDWLRDNGYRNVDGSIGIVMTMDVHPSPEAVQ